MADGDPARETVMADGLDVSLFRAGEGRPLLFLHGAAPAGVWLPFHQLLSSHVQLIAPDHPGFGYTPRPGWLTGMDDLVLHYDALLRTLGLDRPLLAGFSLGGWIAAELAVTYPDRFAGLVLLDAAGLHLDEHPIPDLPALQGEKLARTLFHRTEAARQFLQPPRGREEGRRRYRGMATLALLAWNRWFNPALPHRLGRLHLPALLLWGEHDRVTPPAYGRAYQRLIAGSELKLIAACGHMAHLEDPEAVAGAIAGFAGRL